MAARSMNSALLPQLLKLEEVFDEEQFKAGTTIQEELKSAILLRCRWTAQIILEFDNWRHCSILSFERTHVAADRSQQKWATSMVASSSADKDIWQWMLIESKMPNEKARMAMRKAKVKMQKAKERKEREIRNEMKVIRRAKVKGSPFLFLTPRPFFKPPSKQLFLTSQTFSF